MTPQDRDDRYRSIVLDDRQIGCFFDDDEGQGYFYLLDLTLPEGRQVIGTVEVYRPEDRPPAAEIEIRVARDETRFGLFIGAQLWTVFDLETQRGTGSLYTAGGVSDIHRRHASEFD